MKYIAVFDDKDLSNFRVDGGGRTGYEKVLVVRDEIGSTRGIGLRPLPEKKDVELYQQEFNIHYGLYAKGYNDCLDEIAGETE